MTSRRRPTADDYRKEAEKIRAPATLEANAPVRQQLLSIAASYDELARIVETMGRQRRSL